MAGFDKDKLKEIKALMAEIGDQQNRIEDSVSSYLKHIKKVGEIQAQILGIQKKAEAIAESISKHESELNDLKAKELALTKKITALGHAASQDDIDALAALKTELKTSKESLKVKRTILKEVEKTGEELEIQNSLLADQVKNASKLTVLYNSGADTWKKMPRYAKQFYGYISSLEALNMSRDIKTAALSMGVLSSQSKFFMQTMSDASKTTLQIGVGVSDLAKGQQAYSDAIGRNIMLSESGYDAMAELSRGTLLGADGAASMASDMERFGIGVETARTGVERTVNKAHKMGVDANKAVKNLTGTLKIAQRFNFKGGTKNMEDMSAYAAKMRLEMESMTGMAEKVFRPEGAVEMAARLQTMGGEMARIGDPFQLMFKARNDFGGFIKDIGKAAAEFGYLNKETNEFEISALGMDRIREISQITGIAVDELTNLGRQAAKFEHIKTLIPNVFGDDEKELISSLATFDEDSKQWTVKIGSDKKLLSQLNQAEIKKYKNEQQALKERAIQAQTFDDAFNNLIMQFKTMALPFVEALNENLVRPLVGLQQKMDKSEFIDAAKKLMGVAGEITGSIMRFIVENPIESAIMYAATTVFFNMGQWYAQGAAFGAGFKATIGQGGAMNNIMNTTAGGSFMGNLKGAAGSKMAIGGGAIAGVIGAGMEYFEQKEKGKSTGESLMRGGIKGVGTGLGAWGGAALGASIGALGGPLSPVTVPLGALIGGGVGAWGGGYASDLDTYGVDDAVIKFNPQDKFLKMDDGVVASTSKGKIDDLVSGNNKSTEQKIKFDDININGTIKLELSGSGSLPSRDIELKLNKDPYFIREITKLIQEQLRINIGGGKLNPNPI